MSGINVGLVDTLLDDILYLLVDKKFIIAIFFGLLPHVTSSIAIFCIDPTKQQYFLPYICMQHTDINISNFIFLLPTFFL